MSQRHTTKPSKKQLKRTTTKKERQALKDAKKAAQLKSQTEREAEMQDIKSRLLEWEIDERFESVRQLYEHMAHYVETGETVQSTIEFPECPPQPQGRNIVFLFPRRRGNKCTCDLIVRDGSQYMGQLVSRKDLPQLTPPEKEDSVVPQQASGQVANPIENYAGALEAEMEKFHAAVAAGEVSGPTSVEEARKLAEQVVPSVEAIHAELDRLYLPPENGARVEIVEKEK